jgi:hypothetical protein
MKPWMAAAAGGAIAGLGVTLIGVWRKVQELQSPARRRLIELEVERVAGAEADRYIGASWGMTPERIAAIGRMVP